MLTSHLPPTTPEGIAGVTAVIDSPVTAEHNARHVGIAMEIQQIENMSLRGCAQKGGE
jgi:hypothetical protein